MTDTHQIQNIIQSLHTATIPRAEDRTWDRLAGRVALITGGARGQGAADARLFVAEGAQVLIADVLDDEGAKLASDLGSAARYCHLDVSSEEDWAQAIQQAEGSFGPVSILVNNAGISRVGSLMDLTLEDFRKVMSVNLEGVFIGIRAVVPSMEKVGRGSIINLCSVDGLAAHPGISPYVTSKFGMRGLTKVACLELADRGIRVNTVHPSVMNTPMFSPEHLPQETIQHIESQIPAGFVAEADDVARVIVFLASDESRYISGTEIVVDGGVMAKVPLSPS